MSPVREQLHLAAHLDSAAKEVDVGYCEAEDLALTKPKTGSERCGDAIPSRQRLVDRAHRFD